jgi:acyl-CoA reductase-like NAD-dependent aldehyde dehydrogenase
MWAACPLNRRIEALSVAARRVLEDRETGLCLLRQEVHKVTADALMSELLGALDQVQGWARIVRRQLRSRKTRLNPLAFPGKAASWRLVPRGVVACIAPWNFPVAGLYRPVLPALLTGNAVVVKPSELSTRSAQWYLGHLAEALPRNVLQVVPGGAETGRMLVDSGIDACTFTGSVAAGREVLMRCAERGIVANVELGGKDMAIVLEDCHLPRTVAGITHWALQNAGQSCSAIEVVLVTETIADEFVRRLARAWGRLAVGPNPRADIAPLAHRGQLETVEGQVEQALRRGAKLVCGGRRAKAEHGFEPTILDRCTVDMDIVRQETFGPVLAVVRVAGTDEAVRVANASRYGLTASIWSTDLDRARRIAERLDVGSVTVNNHSLTGAIVDLPWSGTKATGTGIANSELGLAIFTRPSVIMVDRGRSPDPFWLPYDQGLVELGQRLARAQLGDLRGAWKLPFLLRRRVRCVQRFFEA